MLSKKSFYYLLIVFMVSTVELHAQPGPPDDDVTDVPLDGGVSALVVAGIAYGAKKLKDIKDRNRKEI